jgi:hypothetical protein
MSEWTPTTEQVRSHYVFNQSDRWDAERGEAFDRWIAAHDAEVLEEAADALHVTRFAAHHPEFAVPDTYYSATIKAERLLLERANARRVHP